MRPAELAEEDEVALGPLPAREGGLGRKAEPGEGRSARAPLSPLGLRASRPSPLQGEGRARAARSLTPPRRRLRPEPRPPWRGRRRAPAPSCRARPSAGCCAASRFIRPAASRKRSTRSVGCAPLASQALHLLGVERDAAGIVLLLQRIVGADALDEAPVARASASRRRRCGNRRASWRRRGRDGSSGTFRFLLLSCHRVIPGERSGEPGPSSVAFFRPRLRRAVPG